MLSLLEVYSCTVSIPLFIPYSAKFSRDEFFCGLAFYKVSWIEDSD